MAGFNTLRGQTPLSPDDQRGLLVSARTQEELDVWEKRNIESARRWALKSRKLKERLLEVDGICLLHNKMFGDVWEWGGRFRTTQLNIGVAPEHVQDSLKGALEDAKHWLEHDVYSNGEAAMLLHHRLAYIHPFPNGNGRLAREVADQLLLQRGGSRINWGTDREAYLKALRAADKQDYSLLLKLSGW